MKNTPEVNSNMKRSTVFFSACIITIIAAFSFNAISEEAAPVTPPKEEKKQASKTDNVFTEMIIEDFETSSYTNANVQIKKTQDQTAGLVIRDTMPAPYNNSKKYLGVKVFGRKGDVATIIPVKAMIIDKHCKSISMWVYGKKFPGEISLMLRDSKNASHRLIMGNLDYLGWKKLSVNIPPTIAQMDTYLSQKRDIEITRIMYNPGNIGRLPQPSYIYIDDITAQVREKFYDRQSDDW
jgi:hypothetical protein